jgi:hypothetical protein
MNSIETECLHCGQQLAAPTAAVFLEVGAVSASGWLVCDSCDDVVAVPVPAAALAKLSAGGCHVITAPASVSHPEAAPAGPRLGPDDALALHELLDDDDALRVALAELEDLRP